MKANSEDPNQMLHCVASYLDMKCLSMSYKMDALVIFVLFVCVHALYPSKQFFSNVRTFPGLNQS